MRKANTVDCVIVGGGPAGLSAALMLGRAMRNVVVFDQRKPRNSVTRASYGFITHDGSDPRQIRLLALRDIGKYPNVQVKHDTVVAIRRRKSAEMSGSMDEKRSMDEKISNDAEVNGWDGKGMLEVQTSGDEIWLTRKVILATGLKETLPAIDGMMTFYGSSLFSCPYCDGWELREQPIVFVCESEYVFHMCKVIAHWSSQLTVCTNGSGMITVEQAEYLAGKGITVYDERIVRLQGEDAQLQAVELEDGTTIACVGGFVTPKWEQASALAESLGCKMNAFGAVETDPMGRTSVEHVYAAGDNAVIEPALISIAVAEGSRAAIGVNTELVMADF